MKYFSTFSGIGGFELGIKQAYEDKNTIQTESKQTQRPRRDVSDRDSSVLRGNDVQAPPVCVGFSEIDKYATEIYQKHFPNHKNYGDITKINEKELPDFDLLVGGFPCQSFSIAGKRGGFEDTRGTMFFELARILRAKQPRLFVFENVKGLLSHDVGRTFATIIQTIDELGYDCQWQVLNSKNHGVPQNRERVFIIGHLRGTSRPEVFPFGEGNQSVIGIHQLNSRRHSNNRIYSTEGLSPAPNTMQGGNRQPIITSTITTENAHGFGKNVTPRQAFDIICEIGQIRRLTPLECERLQGFPDNWTEGLSDTQRYKCCGNAVTVNVIRDLMVKLL